MQQAECDKFVAVNELAKRRGFFWSSFEIYGGSGGFVTYGPLGTRLKQNVEAKLRELFVKKIGIYEMESTVIAPGKVFEASGHVDHFKEPMVECQNCNTRFRADHLLEEKGISSAEAEKMSLEEVAEEIERHEIVCPDCGGKFGAPTRYLTMFQTTIGPYQGSSATADPKRRKTYSWSSTASTRRRGNGCRLAASTSAKHCATRFLRAKA